MVNLSTLKIELAPRLTYSSVPSKKRLLPITFKLAVLLLCDVEAAFPAASKIALLAGEIVITSLPSAIPERLNPSV